MTIIQSSIELADRAQRRIFVVSIVFGVIAALIAALLAWLVWNANDKYQDALKTDADARIAEAGTKAAVANAEAAKANEGLGKSNAEIARLTTETERAKAERAEADKQIAIAKADAARAKEGIANAEARSMEASVEVSRLRVTVANAEKERAKAEKALLELQQRLADRVIPDADAARIIEQIRSHKGREFQVVTFWDDREPLATANRLAAILVAAGWKLDQPKEGQFLLGGLGGMQVFFHPEASPEAKRAAEALVSALNAVGLSAVIRQMNAPGKPTEKIHINVGTKPM